MMQAIGRIERALARIETLDVKQQSGSPPVQEPSLVVRHDRLKQATRSAVAELDKLLARIGN
jgi:D-aminopeptidase